MHRFRISSQIYYPNLIGNVGGTIFLVGNSFEMTLIFRNVVLGVGCNNVIELQIEYPNHLIIGRWLIISIEEDVGFDGELDQTVKLLSMGSVYGLDPLHVDLYGFSGYVFQQIGN